MSAGRGWIVIVAVDAREEAQAILDARELPPRFCVDKKEDK